MTEPKPSKREATRDPGRAAAPTSATGPSRAMGAGDRAAPKVAILGVGQMGLVCARILGEADSAGGPRARPPMTVTMWAHRDEDAGDLTQTRTSIRLPGFRLAEAIRVTSDLRKAVADADLIVTAIPVQFMRSVWERLRGVVPGGAGVVSVAKGIENDTLLRPTQIVLDCLGEAAPSGVILRPLGVLSGPTIAAELARGLPAVMIAASQAPEFGQRMQAAFSTSYLRIYTSADVLGVELAGAMKNVIAIAAGIIDGLNAGNNAKSALLARGLAEITRLGVALGATQETFFGLAGVGDLATSCFSPEGRNRSCGEALGRGTRVGEHLAKSRTVVEGVATTRSVIDLARREGVDMPIVHAVHQVLYEGMDPIEGIGLLMSRAPKAERVG